MMITVYVLIAIVTVVLVVLGSSVRVVTQFERGVVFRFGRVQPQTRWPGLVVIAPVAMIDSPAVGWGVHIDSVEIKDVALPESMKRSMSRQAEAERERRSRVIIAEGELPADPAASTGEALAHAVGR